MRVDVHRYALNMSALTLVVVVAGVTCAMCWVASLITKDTSWVDRIWSIVPVVYVWIFASSVITSGQDSARLILMAVLVTLWGIRLTFNFARKGGYTGTMAGAVLLVILQSILTTINIDEAGRQIVFGATLLVLMLFYGRGRAMRG